MIVKDFLIVGNIATNTVEIQKQIERLPKPYSVCQVVTPSTLNDLTMGELMELQEISTEKELLFVPCRILLGLNEPKVMEVDIEEVLGFVYWVAKEMERINKLFSSTSVPPTSEEKQAGSDLLNFGPFGLIDYYAQRMGITDHETVEHVPWIRVYKCLDMDAKKVRFERRLRNILSKNK